ncbi:MAG: RNA degradosome polyphosphate kinase, partial [Spirochaetia bacterium]|nr:RNA degradosome polyphosphate kinase [Spirochaetia bacterium]
FNLLTGFSDPPRWNKLVTAPLDLRNFFLSKLEREIENVKNGGKGQVIAKMNAVLDERMMRGLYAASQAGVKIQLVVRGICCLRPGVKGLSENISVISIVDRYLEHSRIYSFYANGEREVFLSSADWMNRNFDRRVEILFPVEEEEHRKEVMDYLQILLADNTHARDLSGDGTYRIRKTPSGEKPRNAQREMYQYIQKRSGVESEKAVIRFIPKTKSEQAG